MLARGAPAILVLATLLAGCATGGEGGDAAGVPTGQDPTGPAASPEGTGTITGLVTDDVLFPIAGATVGIVELDRTTLTLADGSFVLNAIAPGSYAVAAQALGFSTEARQVEVVPDGGTEVDFQLEPLATAEPYIDLQKWSGFLECQVGTSALLANCLPIQNIINMFNLPNPTNTRQIAFWNVSEPREEIEGGLYELVWERSTGFSGEFLTLIVETENSGLTGTTHGQADGTSPVRVRIDEGPYQDLEPENPENDQIQTRVFASGATPPNLVFQQPFDIYSSVFYYADPGDDYTALADA